MGRPASPLLDRLPAAYARSPVDPWPDWAESRPSWVVARGLDTLVGQHTAGAEVDTFWRTIRHRHSSFASALLACLDRVDPDEDPATLARWIEVHADLDHIDDPAAWLASFRIALIGDGFTRLPLSRG